MSDSPQDADFGFRTVPPRRKASMVREVFESVAPRYDVMNDLMSLGIHRVWKRIFVNAIGCSARETLLDLAGGTGDISFLAKDRGAGRVILTDVNPRCWRSRASGRSTAGSSTAWTSWWWIGTHPLPDRSVEKVSIAFGLRNCTDKDACCAKTRRVLRPRRALHCLEFSRLEVAALVPLYNAWSFKALPEIGARVAQDRESYEIPRREHPHVPRPGDARGHDAAGGDGARLLRNPLRRDRGRSHTGWRL